MADRGRLTFMESQRALQFGLVHVEACHSRRCIGLAMATALARAPANSESARSAVSSRDGVDGM